MARQCEFDLPCLRAAERFHASEGWASVRFRLSGSTEKAVGTGCGIACYTLTYGGWHLNKVKPEPSALVGVAPIRRLRAEADVSSEVVECVTDDVYFPYGYFVATLVRQVFYGVPELMPFAAWIYKLLRPVGLEIIEEPRHFVDPMNYRLLTPPELFAQVSSRKLPTWAVSLISSILGSQPVFGLILSVLARKNSRPGQHIALLACKPI